ncbi:MAG: DEAD/DEAH box helicase [Candidatus Hydrogenedentota bacterium]
MGFTVFNFQPRMSVGIRALGFTTPTPIQLQAMPPILAGRDVLGLAQTGTGKTAAFVLPILERLLSGPRHTLRALILAPTRELAEQIHDVIRSLTPHSGITSMTIYGGVGMSPQVKKLREGVDIVVACPGRLLDHFSDRTINVSRLEVLVIDEADRMFDMGFVKDIRKVVAYLPRKRQTLLFSATMPAEVRKLIGDILVQPETVQIGHSAPAATVDHALYPVPQHLKTPLLLELLRKTETGSVLVFTRTKHRAKKVARTLASKGFSSAELQGNLSQNQRQNALDGFRDGRYRVLVATDIAARGIDVSLISHVINYDIPDTTDAYTHRIGRTGRMERGGDAFTFVTNEDKDTVRDIERVMKAPIERRFLEGFDYKQSAPRKDTEFARDPRPPRHTPIQYGKPRPKSYAPSPRHSRSGSGSNRTAAGMDSHFAARDRNVAGKPAAPKQRRRKLLGRSGR